MAITTKTGDSGETNMCGERVKKHHPRIESCGTVDELNCVIGVANCHVKKQSIRDVLEQIQHDLFTLQADICGYDKKTDEDMIEFLDASIKAIEPELPEQKEFILPRGNLSMTHLQLARAVARRAERTVTKLADYDDKVNKNIMMYLNRLSDLLHLFSRAEAGEEIKAKYHRQN